MTDKLIPFKRMELGVGGIMQEVGWRPASEELNIFQVMGQEEGLEENSLMGNKLDDSFDSVMTTPNVTSSPGETSLVSSPYFRPKRHDYSYLKGTLFESMMSCQGEFAKTGKQPGEFHKELGTQRFLAFYKSGNHPMKWAPQSFKLNDQ